MATPTSPSTGQPTSFKTNINRAKTKRWVEAKSYSYDGGDWGDSSGEDYPDPVPSQAPSRPSAGFDGPYPQAAGGNRYGELSFQPPGPPQGPPQGPPPSMRGASNPSPGPGPIPGQGRGRPSFDQGEGRGRTFSLNSQSGYSDGPYASSGRSPFPQGDPYGPPPPRMGGIGGMQRNQSPLRVNTGQRRPSMDHDPYPHAPFIPDSGPSRAPQFRPDSRGGAYPDLGRGGGGPYPQRGGPPPDQRGGPYPRPGPGPGPGPYGDPRGRPGPGPFQGPPSGRIRSQSNGRPSPSDMMDRGGSPSRGGYYGPGPGHPMGPQHRGSNEGLRESSPAQRGPPRKSSLSQEQRPFDPSTLTDTRSSTPEKPPSATTGPPAKALPFIRPADIYKRMEEEKRRQSEDSTRPTPESLGLQTVRQRSSTESLGRSLPGRSSSEALADADGNKKLKPMLDTVSERKSEYGFDNTLPEAEKKRLQTAEPVSTAQQDTEPPSASSTYSNRPDPISASTDHSQNRGLLGSLPEVGRVSDFGDDLFVNSNIAPTSQRQVPSQAQPITQMQGGRPFDNAINQAFDESQNLVPPTPSSSMGDSIIRSNSANTSDVSPIISRHPSNAAVEPRATVTQSEPTIYEEPVESTPRLPDLSTMGATPRPTSSSTIKPTPPPLQTSPDADLPQPPSAFKRNTDSPSPSNSPARQLNISPGSDDKSELALVDDPSEKPLPNPGRAPPFANIDTRQPAGSSESLPSPIPRAESPTKGTVRGLTDRFETTSGRSSPISSPERPSSGRFESFRPSLPGGWNSYATSSDGKSTPAQRDESPLPREPTLAELRQEEAARHSPEKQLPAEPSPERPHEEHTPTNVFAAAGAAALAGGAVLASTIGLHQNQSSSNVSGRRENVDEASASDRPAALQPISTVPAAAKSSASTIPPTPPQKDTPKDEPKQISDNSNYFPLPLRTGRPRSQEESAFATPRQPMIPSLNIDTSPQDTENDRLQEEIVKSLTPHPSSEQVPAMNLTTAPTSRSQVESGVLPKEYESYWNESPDDNNYGDISPESDRHGAAETIPKEYHESESQNATPPEVSAAPKRTLKKRFSWETQSSDGRAGESVTRTPADELPPVPQLPPQATRQEEEFSPAPSPSPPLQLQQVETQDVRDQFSPEPNSTHPTDVPAILGQDPDGTPLHITTPLQPTTRTELPSDVRDMAEPQFHPTPGSGKAEPQIMSFRDIVAIKGTYDKIQAFNHARSQFASLDTGLSDWLQAMAGSEPDLANMMAANARPSGEALGHKTSPSRSKFPLIGSLNAVTQSQFSEEKPSGESSLSGKTEQLLHSAGKFGGKAGGAAKGLFAKGKNKFRSSGGDKAFFSSRRKSQPIPPVVEPPQHSSVGSVPQLNATWPADADNDNTDTWSLSYAPTEHPRPSSEKPAIPTQLGSLAPPPYQPPSDVADGNERSERASLNITRTESQENPLARASSPHVSALGSQDGNDLPSRSISQLTRPTISGDERSPIVSTFSDEISRRLSTNLFKPIEEVEQTTDEQAVDDDGIREFRPETARPETGGTAKPVETRSVNSTEPVTDTLKLNTASQGPPQLPILELSPLQVQGSGISPDENQANSRTSSALQAGVVRGNEPAAGISGPVQTEILPQPPSPTADLRADPSHDQVKDDSPSFVHQEVQSNGSVPDPNRETEHVKLPTINPTPPYQETPEGTRSRPFSFVDVQRDEVLNKPSSDALEQETSQAPAEDDRIGQRPQSFSRPFVPPNLNDHPAFRGSPNPDRRSQTYATEDVPFESRGNLAVQDPYVQHHEPTPEDEPYRIPGPYGSYFKSRQSPSKTQAPASFGQEQQPHQPQPSPERSYIPRSMDTEYALPGVEAPPAASAPQGDTRRRSILFGGRSKSRPRVEPDNDSETFEDFIYKDKPKRKSNFLRKSQTTHGLPNGGQRASTSALSLEAKDRLSQLMSPSPIAGPDGKDPKKKAKKLQRMSTSDAILDDKKQKRSFSRLSGLFGRSSKPTTPPVLQGAANHPAAGPASPRNMDFRTSRRDSQPVSPYQARHGFPEESSQPPSPMQTRYAQPEQFRGRLPPPEGYYAPRSTIPDDKLESYPYDEEDYGTYSGNQAQFQSRDPTDLYEEQYRGRQYTGPTPPQQPQYPQRRSQDRSPLPNLRIDTGMSNGRNHASYPQTAPVRNSSSNLQTYNNARQYGSSAGPSPRVNPSEHVIDLHKRSRSPRAGRQASDDEGDISERNPVVRLGTFRDENRINSLRKGQPGLDRDRGGQETPWRLDLPREPDGNGQQASLEHQQLQREPSAYHTNSLRHSDYDDGVQPVRPSMDNRPRSEQFLHPQPSPTPPSRTNNPRHPASDDDEEMYNDGGYGPPPSKHRLPLQQIPPPPQPYYQSMIAPQLQALNNNSNHNHHNLNLHPNPKSHNPSPPLSSIPTTRGTPIPTPIISSASSPAFAPTTTTASATPTPASRTSSYAATAASITNNNTPRYPQPHSAGNQVYELPGSRPANHPDSDSEDDIIMSPTTYPGQEWVPKVGWED